MAFQSVDACPRCGSTDRNNYVWSGRGGACRYEGDHDRWHDVKRDSMHDLVCTTPSAFLEECAKHGVVNVIPHAGLIVTGFKKVRIEFRPPAPPDPDQEPFRAWAKREGKPDFSLFTFGDLYLAWKDGRKYGEASVDHRAQADLVEKGFGIAIDTLRLHSHHAAADLLRRLRP